MPIEVPQHSSRGDKILQYIVWKQWQSNLYGRRNDRSGSSAKGARWYKNRSYFVSTFFPRRESKGWSEVEGLEKIKRGKSEKCLSSALLLPFHWFEKVFSIHHLLEENE